MSGILSWNSNGPTSSVSISAHGEVEEDGLLDPRVRGPLARVVTRVGRRGRHAKLSPIELRDGPLDSRRACSVLQARAIRERGFDERLILGGAVRFASDAQPATGATLLAGKK